MIILWDAKGGIGSGNWGHAGRKGVKGGSAPIANNSADKIYAGGQKYKQAGGKRSVTDKRKVAYNTKKDAANASSTVSDVSLPKPIDSTPTTQSYSTFYMKVAQGINNNADSFMNKMKAVKELKSQIKDIQDMSTEDKNSLYAIVQSSTEDILDKSISEDRDMIIDNVQKMNDAGFYAPTTIKIETEKALKFYQNSQNDLYLEQSDIDYIEAEFNNIKQDLTSKFQDISVSSLPKSTNDGNTSLDGFARQDNDRAKDFLDSVSKRSGTEAVHFYEYEGDWMVNNYLRNGSLPRNESNARFKLQTDDINPLWASDEDWKASATKGIKNRIKQLDDSMVDELSKPTVLTRFVGEGHPVYNAWMNDLDALGTVYNEANFASTSANINHRFGGSGKVKIRIKAPAGTRGLSFATDYKLRYPDEREFLLPRNSAFKIVGIDSANKEVFVELIDNGVHP